MSILYYKTGTIYGVSFTCVSLLLLKKSSVVYNSACCWSFLFESRCTTVVSFVPGEIATTLWLMIFREESLAHCALYNRQTNIPARLTCLVLLPVFTCIAWLRLLCTGETEMTVTLLNSLKATWCRQSSPLFSRPNVWPVAKTRRWLLPCIANVTMIGCGNNSFTAC